MRKSTQLIYFLRFFGTGIILPVLSLILLSRGATIQTISLIIGFYSVTVIAAEFPSGVFADLYGRKTAFLLSCALSLASYSVFLFSRSGILLLLGMFANGLSRAFSSGSLEALMIDQSADQQIPLERVTARLTILESAGIASGALAGGFLAQIGSRFSANLGVNVFLSALLILLTARFVHESPRKARESAQTSHRMLFVSQVKDSLQFAKQAGIVRVLLGLCLLMGFALNTIEIYWQPALAAFQSLPSQNWLFGAVSFAGFAFVMLGSWLSERLLRKHSSLALMLLLLLKAALGIGLIYFCFAANQFSLVGTYLLLYLLIGGSGVVENTLLNQRAPASHRASILSLFSLLLQLGGVIASLLGYLVSRFSRYQHMWLLSGALLLLFCVAVAFFQKSLRQKSSLDAEAAYAEKN
jgi:MFS family permease